MEVSLFIALRNIIDQMVLICVVGAIANAVGAVVYKAGAAVEAKPDKVVESAAAKEPKENAESEV